MSTVTYADDAAIGTHAKAADAVAAAPRKSFWGRVFDALVAAQQRRAEREIAAYLRSHGGLFNDEAEREIMERLSGRRRSL
ncbi:MAG TPA: hypothetical protein VFA64_09865 [Hyphomicrobiaceae bacterium]|nr:hypothetical protein [Hyphomicrobiaceae bacterium]